MRAGNPDRVRGDPEALDPSIAVILLVSISVFPVLLRCESRADKPSTHTSKVAGSRLIEPHDPHSYEGCDPATILRIQDRTVRFIQ